MSTGDAPLLADGTPARVGMLVERVPCENHGPWRVIDRTPDGAWYKLDCVKCHATTWARGGDLERAEEPSR